MLEMFLILQTLPNQFENPSLFCANKEGSNVGTCPGDSGGPIQCIVDGEWTIVGVVSWGRGCAKKGMPGIYTRLADVRVHDWVQKYIH